MAKPDHVSRETWTIAAAYALLQSASPEALAQMAMGGPQKFRAVAKQDWGRDFTAAELDRIYQLVSRTDGRSFVRQAVASGAVRL